MLLKDVNKRASVDIFLRLLDYPFPKTDIVGLPGGFAAADGAQSEDDLACLIHELEHTVQLTYPLGFLLSALALRWHDLRNEMATAHSSWMRNIPADLEESIDVSPAVEAYRCATMGQSISLASELFTPLLEGLALISETELELEEAAATSYSWQTALEIELAHLEHHLRITQGVPLQREDYMMDLLARFHVKLQKARQRRRSGDMLPTLFWGNPSFPEDPAEPYLNGYLYLRKLEDAWKGRVAGLTHVQFFHKATKLICSLIPPTILPFFSLQDRPHPDPVAFIRHFNGLLKAALLLDSDQIQTLSDPSLITGELLEGKLRIFPLPERILLPLMLHYVFDLRDATAPVFHQEADALRRLERSKYFLRVNRNEVLLVGLDPEESALILADKNRVAIPSEPEGECRLRPGGLTFLILNTESMREFFAKSGIQPSDLPRVKLGRPPDVLKSASACSKAFHKLSLVTYLQFFPDGLPAEESESAVRLVRVVRILLGGSELLWDPSLEEPELGVRLHERENFSKLLLSVNRIFNYEDPEWQFVLRRVEAICPPTSILGMSARNCLKSLDLEDFPSVLNLGRMVYRRQSFPTMTKPTETSYALLRSFRMQLTLGDLERLNCWLEGGVDPRFERRILLEGSP